MVGATHDRNLLQLFYPRHPSNCPQRELITPHFERAAGRLKIFSGESALHVGDGNSLRAKLERVNVDVNLPLLSADDGYLPHAIDAFQPTANDFVHKFCDFSWRTIRRDCQRKNRNRLRINLGHNRRINVLRQVAHHAVDAISHLFGGYIHIFFEHKLDRNYRSTIGRD